MSMWTHRNRMRDVCGGSEYISDWERDERDERRRHALWLVMHGASKDEVARELGIKLDTISYWMRKEAVA